MKDQADELRSSPNAPGACTHGVLVGNPGEDGRPVRVHVLGASRLSITVAEGEAGSPVAVVSLPAEDGRPQDGP